MPLVLPEQASVPARLGIPNRVFKGHLGSFLVTYLFCIFGLVLVSTVSP